MDNRIEKVAYWLGFELVPAFGSTGISVPVWKYPDGIHYREALPDLHSPELLDWLFKYLVAKLIKEWDEFDYSKVERLINDVLHDVLARAKLLRENNNLGERFAEALLEAIIQVIDKEENNEKDSSSNTNNNTGSIDP